MQLQGARENHFFLLKNLNCPIRAERFFPAFCPDPNAFTRNRIFLSVLIAFLLELFGWFTNTLIRYTLIAVKPPAMTSWYAEKGAFMFLGIVMAMYAPVFYIFRLARFARNIIFSFSFTPANISSSEHKKAIRKMFLNQVSATTHWRQQILEISFFRKIIIVHVPSISHVIWMVFLGARTHTVHIYDQKKIK